MTLTALRIANFKAFAASQRVPLRPITLVYGANSAGKSSIIHAIAFAHHVATTGEVDVHKTAIGGDSIDLGGFLQYVHRRDSDLRVSLGFELSGLALSGRLAELLGRVGSLGIEISIGRGETFPGIGEAISGGDAVGGDLQDDRAVVDLADPKVERFDVTVDNLPLLSLRRMVQGHCALYSVNHDHPILRKLFKTFLLSSTTTDSIGASEYAILAQVVNTLIPAIRWEMSGFSPRLSAESTWESVGGDSEPSPFVPISRGRRSESITSATKLFLPGVLRDLVTGPSSLLQRTLDTFQYLGPLRSYPPRHLALARHHDTNWVAGGGQAWELLRARDDVREKINQWLSDPNRLKTPYEIQIQALLPSTAVAAGLSPRLMKTSHNLMVSLLELFQGETLAPMLKLAERIYEDEIGFDPDDLEDMLPDIQPLLEHFVDAESISKRWIKDLVDRTPERIDDMMLVDRRNKTPVSHRDVGIGVSQVLPVLVSAFASKEKILAIEQPEIHLHPALQAELGDVFIESALGEGKNMLLLESHSEHLLLRIMRRMRETYDGTLPDGLPEVRPEHVQVLFVEPDGPRSIVREMPLNERGELEKAWPGGFFEEGLREIF